MIMENIRTEITRWYEDLGELNHLNTYFHIVNLVRFLRAEHDITKKDLEEVGPIIVSVFKKELKFDLGNTVYQTFMAYKVKEAFSVVFTDIKEIIETREEPDSAVEKKQTTSEASTEGIEDSPGDYETAEQDDVDRDFLDGLRFENYE